MSQILFSLMSVVVGSMMALYLPVVSQMGKMAGSHAVSNAAFFFVGAVTSTVIALGMASGQNMVSQIKSIPFWMLGSGIFGGLAVYAATLLLPRLGPGPFFLLLVAGQVVTGAILSHFGLLFSPVAPLGLFKVLGIFLVLIGTGLVVLI